MSFNDFKENKCFTVKNWSRFAGITSSGTIESYKGTNSYESKNKYSSVDCLLYFWLLTTAWIHWSI